MPKGHPASTHDLESGLNSYLFSMHKGAEARFQSSLAAPFFTDDFNMIKKDEVMSVLDACKDRFTFPMLDNGYEYLAATRLSLFRSPDDWAMVIEIFGYSPRGGVPSITISTFGSKIHNREASRVYVDQETHDRYLLYHPHNEVSFICPIDDGDWIGEFELVAENAQELILRGETIPLPDVKTVDQGVIILCDAPRIRIFELCRAIAHTHREQVLASPEERRINVPDELELILTLDECNHPDVAGDARPSNSSTFQMLAHVLECGDTSLYQPKDPPNTHWINWPEGGTL